MPRNCISWKVACVADCHLASEAGGSAVTQACGGECVKNELVAQRLLHWLKIFITL